MTIVNSTSGFSGQALYPNNNEYAKELILALQLEPS
jgi:hypothetical protein